MSIKAKTYRRNKTNYHQALNNIKASENPVFFIKLETNGLDVLKNRVIAIRILKAVFKDGHFVEKDRFKTLMNPGVEIPDEITKFNGITNEMLITAPSECDAMKSVYEFIGPDANVIGFNMKHFVIPFLQNAGFYSGEMLNFDNIIDINEMAQELIELPKKVNCYNTATVLQILNIDSEKDIMGAFLKAFNSLYALIPTGTTRAKIMNAALWSKSYACTYIFFDTNCGKVALNCRTGFWKEHTPGFFDQVDMDALTNDILEKRNVKTVREFIKLYTT